MFSYISLIRISFLVVYSWIGILKVLNISDASPLVTDLLFIFLPKANPDIFIFYLGLLEIFIGISFFIPRFTRMSIFITSLHLLTTFLPLFLLPTYTWNGVGVLTITGQYILKNLFIVSGLVGLLGEDNYMKKKVLTSA